MTLPIIDFWEKYFTAPHEGLGSTYERIVVNELLFRLVNEHKILTVLESPSFGFTGLSGINSLGLALAGAKVTVTDTVQHRLNLISELWRPFETNATFTLISSDGKLPFSDGAFDMAWNFFAMWFVSDLALFCKELSRVSKWLIVIMVPNRNGLGYKIQMRNWEDDLNLPMLEQNIKPQNFTRLLAEQGWQLKESNYIDCPLWPDIFMSKEDFLKKIRLGWLLPKANPKKKGKTLSIMNYYNNSEPDMKKKMLSYSFFERHLPGWLKRFWSHHKYYVFVKAD